MSVRQSLLAILDQGPCYGYQLRHEFDRRTGALWPLNVGQIYNTLERLERDGMVRRGEADAHGHIYWEITSAGSTEVARWLSSPVLRASAARDEVTVKLAVAATLPGVDVDAALRTQRAATRARRQELEIRSNAALDPMTPEDLAASLVLDSMIFAAEAEERWLDHVEARLAEHPEHALRLALTTQRPKRGRPTKVGEPAGVLPV